MYNSGPQQYNDRTHREEFITTCRRAFSTWPHVTPKQEDSEEEWKYYIKSYVLQLMNCKVSRGSTMSFLVSEAKKYRGQLTNHQKVFFFFFFFSFFSFFFFLSFFFEEAI